jgi:hypothetical protein
MVMLSEAGIQSYGMKRGLDHGVFSGFHVGTFTEYTLSDVLTGRSF